MPTQLVRGKAATANIEVEYNGFSPEAQTAFQRAVEIWETHIQSEVTIKVVANYGTEADPNVLASAGPNTLWFGTTDEGVESIYPDALIDALLGTNAAEDDSGVPNDSPDIVANFSDQINWYFGPPDSGPAAGEFDFTTVALHEIGHGLGFFGSMTVSSSDPPEGSWGFGTSDPAVPAVYDRFAEDGAGDSLTNTARFQNPSTLLADILTSNDVFFSGLESNGGAEAAATGPVPPKLHLPSTWNGGSSYSHLDEPTYPLGDTNSLMTPRIGGNEVIHSPGSVTCGMFADMGWPLGPGCEALLDVEVAAFDVEDAGRQNLELTWFETRIADVDRYEIVQTYFDGPPQVVETFSSEGAQQYTVPLRGLDIGKYAFRLFFIRPSGERVLAGEGEITVPLRKPFELAEVYPNPFSTQANIKLTVRSAQNFRVEVYNALGQRVAVLYDRQRPANDPRPITFDAAQLGTLPSGRYFFRVIGRNFEEVRSAVFVR